MKIQTAISKESIQKCFTALNALRPHLEISTFVTLIEGMIARGYHLIFVEENNQAVAIAGFRYTEHLHWGKLIYIDDLSTLPEHRGKGYASLLLKFIEDKAGEAKLDSIHLDSGSVPSRYDAHRLYLNKGFNISSFHFAKNLKQ